MQEVIWREMEELAVEAGLDPQKFTAAHRAIVQSVVDFLERPSPTTSANEAVRPSAFGKRLAKTVRRRTPAVQVMDGAGFPGISPIIICGEPGTGKTTFLYVLDTVIRRHFGLPDNIAEEMEKGDGRCHIVQKRAFNSIPVSLLSVSKWSQLLHFYAWDANRHQFDEQALAQFVQITLHPMRVLFADEVEMTGYSPTIPQLANQGILVVGTSNQYAFKQLDDKALPPEIYRFKGVDMRVGDPTDAIVTAVDPLWSLFAKLQGSRCSGLNSLSIAWGSRRRRCCCCLILPRPCVRPC